MAEGSSKITTRLAALIAGGAAVGLGASLWAPWYGADLSDRQRAFAEKSNFDVPTLDAWAAFVGHDFLDILLAVAAGLGLVLLACALAAPASSLSRVVAAIASVVGVAGAVMVIVRLIHPPGSSATLESGAFLGLLCVVALAGAATLAAGKPARE